MKYQDSHDYDYVVIGSGFGGSVSAFRLSQKGYKVAIIEAGKRWKDSDFPDTNWSVRKFLWLPQLFCYGIQRINLLKDVMILGGAGVGGGSLVYANTLYIPLDKFFENEIIQKLGGKDSLLPFYQIAQKMLGVNLNPNFYEADHLLKETAKDFGVEDTFKPTPVGVFFGESGQEVDDPYFYGEGPRRTGCIECGGCMVGCQHNAKNTLEKNYLYFAEKLGAKIVPERKVIDIKPLSQNGEAGYQIKTKRSTHLLGFPYQKITTRGVVFSAGVLGTLHLMLKLKEKNRLPSLSNALGHTVRTNSEAILGITSRDKQVDYTKGVAITSSIYPDAHSHIEPVRYPVGSDFMSLLATVLTDGGGKMPRQLRYFGNIIKSPVDFARTVVPIGFAKRSVILLFMQTLDNSIRVVRKRRWFWPFSKMLSSENEEGVKSPSYIPLANQFAKKMASKSNAIPQSAINEVLLDIPTTAHILGGCSMGVNHQDGVIDLKNQVFGYKNMLVCDGSMIPANLGVNPSLSITAFSERAMSFIPPKDNNEVNMHYLKAEEEWGIKDLLLEKNELAIED